RLGQPVLVENRPGAFGFVAMQHVARAKPDGYTLGLSSLVYQVLNPALHKEKLPYNPDRDFAPVALLARVPYILVAAPGFPANDVKELVAQVKRDPGKYNYGLPGGSGNTSQIVMEYFKKTAGLDVQPVPFQGDAPSLAAVMGNQVEMTFTTPLGATQLIRSGKLKLIGTATATRLPTLPQGKTFAEQGYGQIEASTWFSFLAPAATPRPIRERLNAEIEKVLAMPEVRAQIEDLGSTPAGGSLDSIDAFMRAEKARWTKRVEESGAKLE
ncbi:MAG TPA: tripartite tricarboxylate transporter substrate-binding protein, partial [Ramlibacter sp.]|nr:tripartite tricarboxylate transporter substrate-binding protein [Ramlibacter sp.]